MSDEQNLFNTTNQAKKPNNQITDEMAMDYAIFLYNLYRNAKFNYNNMKGNQ